MRLPGDLLGHQLRHPLDDGLDTFDLARTLGDGVGHLLDMAVAAVVEHENLGHADTPSQWWHAGNS